MANKKQKIILNAAKCLLCEDFVESKTVHDFQTCSCGNLSVDGGKDYLKRCWHADDSYIDCFVIEEEE